MYFSPNIHLYVNVRGRQSWCQDNGREDDTISIRQYAAGVSPFSAGNQ